MNLEIVLTSEDVQSDEAKTRFNHALKTIANLILEDEMKEKPRWAPGRESATKEGDSFDGLSLCY